MLSLRQLRERNTHKSPTDGQGGEADGGCPLLTNQCIMHLLDVAETNCRESGRTVLTPQDLLTAAKVLSLPGADPVPQATDGDSPMPPFDQQAELTMNAGSHVLDRALADMEPPAPFARVPKAKWANNQLLLRLGTADDQFRATQGSPQPGWAGTMRQLANHLGHVVAVPDNGPTPIPASHVRGDGANQEPVAPC